MKFELTAIHRPTLLDGYDASTPFLLASPRRALLAKGVRARVASPGGPGQLRLLPDRVRALLARERRRPGEAAPLVVGAIPFDENLPAHLLVPQTVRWAAPFCPAPDRRRLPSLSSFTTREVPEASVYLRAVEQAVARLRRGELEKVVLARSLELTAPWPVDVVGLLRNLARRNPGAYTFALDLHAGRAVRAARGPVFLGASPELLVSRSKLQVLANPLAGSRPRSSDAGEDQKRARELLRSRKDLREHDLVVQAVVAALRPFCADLLAPAPELLATSTMWHLSTEIRGQLRDPDICSLTLAAALHPTPAVCGTPTDRALATIRELEGFERGFYSGLIGWCGADGDGDWIVAIRCGEVAGRSIRMFAGAGIIDQSRPEEELAETSAKLRTLLSGLGLETAA